MVWTQDDTKDVLKKIFAAVVAAFLISILSALLKSLTLITGLVIASITAIVATFILLMARKRVHAAPNSEVSNNGDKIEAESMEINESLEVGPPEVPASTDVPAEEVYSHGSIDNVHAGEPAPDMQIKDADIEVKKSESGILSLGDYRVKEVLYDGDVEVEKQESLQFDLRKGDVVEGTLREKYGQMFDCYIIDERNYPKFCSTREGRIVKEFMDDSSYFVKWQVKKSGIWYFVFDLYGKQNPRSIKVTLRRFGEGP